MPKAVEGLGQSSEADMIEYELRDFYLTAYLMTLGVPVIRVVTKNPKKATFVLRAKKELEDSIRDYYNGRGSVDPILYRSKIQSLKSLLYDVGGIKR